MELKSLEKKYKAGVEVIKAHGYYEQIIAEAHFLVKYINPQFFLKIFSENLFVDIKGVFGSFVRQDLRKVYKEMITFPNVPVSFFLEQRYVNLIILQKCASNLRYQVKSLTRMSVIKDLKFKSSFFQTVSRKLNGEIQDYYQVLERRYKQYFRMKFVQRSNNNENISMQCIEDLAKNYDDHLLIAINRFYQLSSAINFVKDLFKMEIENELRNHMATVFFEKQDKLERIIDYFINDLKRNFIHTLYRHIKNGKSFEWIEKGMHQFIESERFEILLRRVILQTLTIIRRHRRN